LALAGSARPARFQGDIGVLLDAGTTDLRQLAAACGGAGSAAVVYPCRGEVRTELLDPPLYDLLLELDGRTPAGRVATRLGIRADLVDRFLRFALAEGIVIIG
jgi:hypothetical protein